MRLQVGNPQSGAEGQRTACCCEGVTIVRSATRRLSSFIRIEGRLPRLIRRGRIFVGYLRHSPLTLLLPIVLLLGLCLSGARNSVNPVLGPAAAGAVS